MAIQIPIKPNSTVRFCVGLERGSFEDHLLSDVHALLDAYEERNGKHIPIDLEALSGLLGCRIQYANMPRRAEGLLVPVSGGFVIRVNAFWPTTRQRFTIAHELIHTLFYDRSFDVPVKVADRILHDVEETLCNQGAE